MISKVPSYLPFHSHMGLTHAAPIIIIVIINIEQHLLLPAQSPKSWANLGTLKFTGSLQYCMRARPARACTTKYVNKMRAWEEECKSMSNSEVTTKFDNWHHNLFPIIFL